MQIFIHRGGQQLGPYDGETLQAMIENGQLRPDDAAWMDGCVDWVRLDSLVEIERVDVSVPSGAGVPPRLPAASANETGAARFAALVGDSQDPDVVKKVLKTVNSLLTEGESVEYIGVQKKPVVTLAPDAVVLTNKRFMIVCPKLMGMTFHDHLWVDVVNVHLSEQLLGATISCQLISGTTISVDYIPKTQARRIYTFAQRVEEQMRYARRAADMEMARAKAGGVVIQAPAGLGGAPAPAAAEDPVTVLTRLKQMYDAGLIEAAEFTAKKSEVLARM